MIVYFTASVIGKRYQLPHYLEVIKNIKDLGHKVLSDHIIQTTEDQIKLETKAERVAFLKKLAVWINSSNCVVVEASFPSISVGYEISLARSYNKPVLILYSEGNPPSLFAQSQDENIICEKYNKSTLKAILFEFLTYAQSSNDRRFTFYLTPSMANFLETQARRYRVPKSVYLRRLIEREIKNSHR
ncbi:MAG: hypothetical protein M1120_02110 [Patescibacteria group bacterium]|nr:hypothetical protein [Patescibacteria group bacterium]